ncbi:hypothetical protein E0H80_08575 [Acinetobacter sp. ANC 4779]|nr:hypothetical protein E0H80_08575 [Acinetobacter sp. ANC 4779]
MKIPRNFIRSDLTSHQKNVISENCLLISFSRNQPRVILDDAVQILLTMLTNCTFPQLSTKAVDNFVDFKRLDRVSDLLFKASI